MTLGGAGFRVQEPTLVRNHAAISHNAYSWLDGKRADDGCDANLWRIHDKLYDLSSFIESHPGGRDFIQICRGTDITESFETHHLRMSTVRPMIDKYFVRNADIPRNSPITFKPDGLYCTLRERVVTKLTESKLNVTGSTLAMRCIVDGLLAGTICCAVLGVIWNSYIMICLAGVLLTLAGNAAHNFFHQRDNWRMYVFDLLMLSSLEWRVTHGISHHNFPNTVYDIEISAPADLLNFYPKPKSFVLRKLAPYYFHIVSAAAQPIEFTKRWIDIGRGARPFRMEHTYVLVELVAFALGNVWLHGSDGFFYRAFMQWLVMHIAASYVGITIGITAAHHHPDCWHTGDDYLYGDNNDYALIQLDAVRDRADTNKSIFLVAVSYGDHLLHHLFPTIDHGKLHVLNDVLTQTLEEFKIDFPLYTAKDMFTGMFEQLGRDKPHCKADRQRRLDSRMNDGINSKRL
jgi:fatty acid desaturase